MGIRETKVYFDGSHYIAIPHIEGKKRYRPKPKEETITVAEKEVESAETDTVSAAFSRTVDNGDIWTVKDSKEAENACMTTVTPSKTARTTTKKALFDELYKTYIGLKRRESKRVILTEMRPYFDTDEQARDYITAGFERKQRNLICRRIRMIRKANLAGFNFFVTFTYNEKLHTEDTFKKQLQNCFRNFCYRKGWKYMGVWERSPGKQRLHFHGLFAIPENTLPDELKEVRDYSVKTKRVQISAQCAYFTKRFGRNDFKELDPRLLSASIKYLLKYIEKSGERIVYSKGLYQYFISDIMDEDVLCRTGQEDKKLLLADNFTCWDEGMYMGKVSPEVIAQLRKSN